MSVAYVTLGGATVVLDPAGALVEPRLGVLVVADLHLETGSAYARRGALLPPYDTMATLARLEILLRRWQPRMVVSLGDAFHDRHGPQSLSPAAFDRLRALMTGICWVWVTGNHDRSLPVALGGAVVEALEMGGLILRHIPSAGTRKAEIAGHLHPKGRVEGRRLRLSRPCFVGDRTRFVLPAFGSYTGGLNALDPAVSDLFGDGFTAFLLGDARVFAVPHAQLVPEAPLHRVAWPVPNRPVSTRHDDHVPVARRAVPRR